MKFVKVKQEDYLAWYLIFRVYGLTLAWATKPNDPWRDQSDNPKRFGFMKEIGHVAIGYAFILGKLKIGTVVHKNR